MKCTLLDLSSTYDYRIGTNYGGPVVLTIIIAPHAPEFIGGEFRPTSEAQLSVVTLGHTK